MPRVWEKINESMAAVGRTTTGVNSHLQERSISVEHHNAHAPADAGAKLIERLTTFGLLDSAPDRYEPKRQWEPL